MDSEEDMKTTDLHLQILPIVVMVRHNSLQLGTSPTVATREIKASKGELLPKDLAACLEAMHKQCDPKCS